jgi:hypothetical protein
MAFYVTGTATLNPENPPPTGTSPRSTVKAAENGKITNREASTRLARLVESIDDSRTAEAMMAARSLVGDGRDVPRKIDNMIKRRLGNGHC